MVDSDNTRHPSWLSSTIRFKLVRGGIGLTNHRGVVFRDMLGKQLMSVWGEANFERGCTNTTFRSTDHVHDESNPVSYKVIRVENSARRSRPSTTLPRDRDHVSLPSISEAFSQRLWGWWMGIDNPRSVSKC